MLYTSSKVSSDLLITRKDVQRQTENLNKNKSVGPGDVYPAISELLVVPAGSVVGPVCYLFHTSADRGKTQNTWSGAEVVAKHWGGWQ